MTPGVGTKPTGQPSAAFRSTTAGGLIVGCVPPVAKMIPARDGNEEAPGDARETIELGLTGLAPSRDYQSWA